MNEATRRSKSIIDKALRVALDFKLDNDRKQRLEESLCIACFYRGPSIAGQAITNSVCGMCQGETRFPSTAVDRICKACAKRDELCKKCGADLTLRQRLQIETADSDEKKHHPTEGKREMTKKFVRYKAEESAEGFKDSDLQGWKSADALFLVELVQDKDDKNEFSYTMDTLNGPEGVDVRVLFHIWLALGRFIMTDPGLHPNQAMLCGFMDKKARDFSEAFTLRRIEK
jgi:hypothetical protein